MGQKEMNVSGWEESAKKKRATANTPEVLISDIGGWLADSESAPTNRSDAIAATNKMEPGCRLDSLPIVEEKSYGGADDEMTQHCTPALIDECSDAKGAEIQPNVDIESDSASNSRNCFLFRK